MNPLYEVLTAAEAAELWCLEASTVRRACWEARIPFRKSGGTNLVAMADMRKIYGPMPREQAAAFIEGSLVQADVEAWCNMKLTRNVKNLLRAIGTDDIEIWGGHEGPEPLSVVVH